MASLRENLPAALTAPHRLLVVDIRSAGFGAFLPYRLLRWVKKRNAAGGGGFLNGGGGESDGDEGKKDHRHHHKHHHSHHHKHHHKHGEEEEAKAKAGNDDGGGNSSLASFSSVEQQQREESATAAARDPVGPFEFIYYSEADNILQLGAPESLIHIDRPRRKSKEGPAGHAPFATTMKPAAAKERTSSRSEVLQWSQRRRGRVAAALLSFLRSPDGLKSYVAPQRLENR